LEASFIKAEQARVSIIQWGNPFSGKFRSTEIEREIGDSGTWLFLPSPDIYSWRVSNHLEATFIRAEPARVSVIQWGTPFSGKFISTEIERDLGDLGTWVILTITQSIFLESFRAFGGHLHQGQTS
jgi:hypothetical protein